MNRFAFVTAAAVLGLAACDLGPGDDMGAAEPAPGAAPGSTPPSGSAAPGTAPAAPTPVPTLTPSGPAVSVQPDAEENLQWAAAVVQLDPFVDQNAKLFGTAGGDPAMNGLQTYIAFFESTSEGWRVFRLGDFLAYRVLAVAPGRIDIEIDESVMNPTTNEISSRTRRAIVAFTPGVNRAPPATVTLTPAT